MGCLPHPESNKPKSPYSLSGVGGGWRGAKPDATGTGRSELENAKSFGSQMIVNWTLLSMMPVEMA